MKIRFDVSIKLEKLQVRLFLVGILSSGAGTTILPVNAIYDR